MKNPRQKGNAAEREIAKLLSDWWRQINPKANFVRTPGSGGWQAAPVRAGFRASGDVMTDDVSFPFTVEAKRRENWSTKAFVTGTRSPVWKWWAQACKQGTEMNLVPMLWVRKNRMPHWIVLVPKHYAVEAKLPPFDLSWQCVVVDVEPVAYLSTTLLAIDPAKLIK